MQTGIGNIILAAGSADGGNITDVLHHGCQCDRHNGNDGSYGLTGIMHTAEHGRAPVNGQTHPGCFLNRRKVNSKAFYAKAVTDDTGHCIGAENTNENGNDLGHALTEHIHHDHNTQSNQRQPPVIFAVGNSGGCQAQTDSHNDGAGYNRREETHHLIDTDNLDDGSQHQIQQTGASHAHAGIGQHFRVGNGQLAVGVRQFGCYRGITAQESKGAAQESRHLKFGEHMEQQGTQTGHQQGGGNIQPGNQRHQHGGAEHSKHVLEAQQQHPRRTQLACIVNALRKIDFVF